MTTMFLQPHQHHFVSIDAAVANLLESRFERPDEAFDPLSARRDVPVDILQTDNELVVRAAVPGFTPEDINVVVLSGVLSLKGDHKPAQPHSRGQYLRQTGVTASGSTMATVTSYGCTATLAATAPVSPGFVIGDLTASCGGQPSVPLRPGVAVTVCSGIPKGTGSIPVTYKIAADWAIGSGSHVPAIVWTIAQP